MYLNNAKKLLTCVVAQGRLGLTFETSL